MALRTLRTIPFRSALSRHASTSSPHAKLSSLPITVKVSAQEVAAQRLTWRNLELATRAIHRDGLVVLQDVIEHAKLDGLNEKMLQDARTLQDAGDASSQVKSNIQQDPPMTEKYFEGSIIVNRLATQVTSSVLGPRPRLSFISGNSALPPSTSTPPQSQPVHSDADFEHPDSPFALVVNVPLVEMSEENGSTEIWLGSHATASIADQEGEHGDRASGRIKTDLLAQRRLERPPSQPLVKKGSLVIRDLRLWHAGKPNFSSATRVMLAMIHFAPWFR
ncbi:ARM repeat-containing protein [Coleophoma crateriformis]|uniref:ARM repeat-containing protein n=1 Tax=Coleophoma crateriformis TaxID=565419 RepID=A0A3D8QEE2_9HELO|nr:ARM repeat-containing protein [Coleophoma crateriformis]